jgi:hypothetical protein
MGRNLEGRVDDQFEILSQYLPTNNDDNLGIVSVQLVSQLRFESSTS